MKTTEETFNDLYETYYTTILGQILRRVKNLQTAEDLTQETFVKVYHALPHTEINSRVHAWLYVIALNVVRDYHRSYISKQGKNEDINGWLDTLHYSSMENEVENRELVTRVFRYLPERTQLIMILLSVYGYTIPEIAVLIGKNYHNIKSMQYRDCINVKKLFKREIA